MTARTCTLLGPDRQPYQSTTPGALGGHRPPGHRARRVRQESRVLRRRAGRCRGRVPAMRRVPARRVHAVEVTAVLTVHGLDALPLSDVERIPG